MKNCYFAMLLLLSAAFAAGCADDKEEGGNDIKAEFNLQMQQNSD